MNANIMRLDNHYDRRGCKLAIIMYIIFIILMVSLSILADKLFVYIIISGLLIVLFYMLFIDEIRRTAFIVEIGQDGITLHFRIGGLSFLKWSDMTGWSQYQSAGMDSYIGIWKNNKKVYNFDKDTARTILIRYSEANGRALVQRQLK